MTSRCQSFSKEKMLIVVLAVLFVLTLSAIVPSVFVAGSMTETMNEQVLAGGFGASPIHLVKNIHMGYGSPNYVEYNPANNMVYVSLAGSGAVAVINASTNKVVTRVVVGGFPLGVEYDPANHNIYVVCAESGQMVYVIDSKTNKVIASESVASSPIDIIYNPADGNLWELGTSGVSVISGVTNHVIKNIATGGAFALSMVYDPANHDVYVANADSNTVSVINTASEKLIKTIPVGASPYGVAYDPANQNILVMNSGSNSVSVISSKTNKVIATVPAGTGPNAATFDPRDHNMYVTNWDNDNAGGSNSVTIINAQNKVVATVKVGANPYGDIYDPKNGDVYVLNYASTSVSVISASSHEVVAIVGTASGGQNAAEYVSSNHEIYVADNGVSILSS